jgi:acetyl-CoA carboxylase carboxyltransferase component
MGAEQAASVLITVKNDQLVRQGLPPLNDQATGMIRQPIMAAAAKEGTAMYSTANLWDDGVLDPARTRDVLGLALSVVAYRTDDSVRGHGTFRM